MKKKWMAALAAIVLALSLAACGAGKETTVSGMVVSLEGTTLSLVEMDADSLQMPEAGSGERPQMPEGMEGFGDFDPENFDPESFEGKLPEGGDFSRWEEGEMPQMPEGMELPEGMTMPEDGKMPGFAPGGMDFGGMTEDMETIQVDVADAHISVEIDGGKESGSLESLQPGTFVTVTMNGKGQATYVLISQQSFFARGNRSAN